MMFETRGRQPLSSCGPKTNDASLAGRTNFSPTILSPFAVAKYWEFMQFQSRKLLILTVHNQRQKCDMHYIYSTLRFLISTKYSIQEVAKGNH